MYGLLVFLPCLYLILLVGLVALYWVGLEWRLCHKHGWQQITRGHLHHLLLGAWSLLSIGLTIVLYNKVSLLLVLLFLVFTSLFYFGSGLWDRHQWLQRARQQEQSSRQQKPASSKWVHSLSQVSKNYPNALIVLGSIGIFYSGSLVLTTTVPLSAQIRSLVVPAAILCILVVLSFAFKDR